MNEDIEKLIMDLLSVDYLPQPNEIPYWIKELAEYLINRGWRKTE